MNEAGMDEETKRALNGALASYIKRVLSAPQGPSSCPIVFNNCPVTINGGTSHTLGWLMRALHVFESSSVRIVVCILGIVTLISIVKYELGCAPPTPIPLGPEWGLEAPKIPTTNPSGDKEIKGQAP